MDGWVDYLHFTFLGEHVLFASLRLKSLSTFLGGSVLISGICIAERLLTVALSKHWGPRGVTRSRLRRAIWRTLLYSVVTTLRLIYMLVAMSYHVGLIFVTVASLSTAQFVVEYLDTYEPHTRSFDRTKEPLLPSPTDDNHHALESIPVRTRPRAKSKPDAIFIHPNESNLARADAVAVELGLGGDTDRVQTNRYPKDQEAWEHGRGRDVARELFGSRPEGDPFHTEDDD
ncbi:hypothetical protein BV22DRAFT_1196341 [Leucogyrophana mollusca]|uniref:Uncharacterized protein n=1 Tax=Leucogyrophana mollusca TaxID=85980 RepID=A0ACB8BEV4_9AGAM|nr:hypothetical protein BV22DRAFT_1196341 [Leucogyrophana mollusca]